MGVLAAASASEPAHCAVSFKDARVWTGAGFETRTLHLDANGRLVDAAVDGAPQLNAAALHLMPPMVDAHTHTIDTPTGPADARHEKSLRAGVLYAINPNNIRPPGPARASLATHVVLVDTGGGVTAPGGHPRPLYEMLARNGWAGAGVTLESLPGRAFHEATAPAQARAAVRAVKANGASLVKLYLLAHGTVKSQGLSAEAFEAAADEARRQGLRPIVHIETAADFRRAVRAKVAGIMHMPYSLGGGDGADRRITADDARAAAAAGVIVVPTMTPATTALSGEPLRTALDMVTANLRTLRDAGVRMAVGADNYNLGPHDELQLLRMTGLFDAPALVAMASDNGHRLAFDVEHRLAPGFAGSLVGYYMDPTRDWTAYPRPVLALREGRVVLDDAGMLAKACGAPALKSPWAP